MNPAAATAADPTPTDGPRGNWLVRISVENPFLVIVICLFIIVIGYVCLDRIPVDILPTYETPAVQVLTLYPGMPTEFMDRTITNRIERWTGQAVGIERQESRTMIGVSVVRDYFSEGTDPNAAFAQVASLASADLYYLPPGTVPPMVMLYDPTAPLPTAYLAASSDVLDETKVYELAYFNVRNMLQGTPGVIAPAVFGGKLRRIYGELDPLELHARNLSFMDVQRSMANGSPMIPPGRIKLGQEPGVPDHLRHKDVLLSINNMPDRAVELNQIPVKTDHLTADSLRRQVDIKAVGGVADRAAIQTNLVRITRAPAWQGKQTVYIPILRRPGSNTIEVVDGVKKSIPTFLDRLPSQKDAKGKDLPDSGLKLDVVADQSVFVRNAINNLLWEGALGAVLASLMVLFFIGSFRSTIVIALTIPLAALVAVIGLYFTDHTLNLMTLGGLALVMGRLVDDPIVDIENTFRHLDMGKPPIRAAIDSAKEIAMPVLVATITTVAVFFPVIFLYGMGKYLFKPLTLSVAFAMFASYFLSRTLSPAYCAYFLKKHAPGEKRFVLFRVCDAGFYWLCSRYAWLLARAIRWRGLVVLTSLALLAVSAAWYPFIGRELFPTTDANQIVINIRLPAGTRIEKTRERIAGTAADAGIESVVMEVIPEEDRQLILSDMGVLFDWPAGYTANAGPMDVTMLLQLTDSHRRSTSSQEYANRLRRQFAADPRFRDVQFSFNTGGMISAALNFGLPAPINVQVRGRDMRKQYDIAKELAERLQAIPGAVDIRVQQQIDYPTIGMELDHKRMADVGVTMKDAAENMLSATNGSDVLSSLFWLDYVSGNHIYMGVTLPESQISWQNLMLTPIRGKDPKAPAQQLQNLVKSVDYHKKTAVEINHQELARVIDIYINVEGRDVGSVAADIENLLTRWGGPGKTSGDVTSWPAPDSANPGQSLAGYAVQMRGEVTNMKQSFGSLGFGFVLAVILIYLIMVALFRSFLDPFIILFAVPLGLIGVSATMALTQTTLNVQSFMGVIFMVGIAVSNSILLVEFANRTRTEHGKSSEDAAIEAGRVRLRPILMTSLAAVFGLLPLALQSGEATTPLARTVIGGLTVSTVLSIFVVPCLYVMIRGRRSTAAPVGSAARPLTLLIAMAAALTLSGVACNNKPGVAPEPPASPRDERTSRKIVRPAREDVQLSSSPQPAHVEAYERTDIHAKVAGYLARIGPVLDVSGKPLLDENGRPRLLDIGDRVKKDQVLAELDVPELQQQVRQKAAQIEQAAAEVRLAEATATAYAKLAEAAAARIKQARTEVARFEAEVAFRKAEYELHLRLLEKKLSDEQTVEARRKDLRVAEAAVATAQAAVAAAEAHHVAEEAKAIEARSSIDAARARAKVTRTELEQAEILLGFATIRAPYDGVITRRGFDTGALVPTASSGKSEPIYTLARTDRLRIVCAVNEADAGFVQVGQPAVFRLDAAAGRTFHGKVARFADVLDASTRTMRTEIELNASTRELRPGMFGSLSIQLADLPGAVLIPTSALSTAVGKPFVWCVEAGRAVRRPIETGLTLGDRIVVARGLTGDEQVVADGKAALREGEAIDVDH